jgi:hypothetical protein
MRTSKSRSMLTVLVGAALLALTGCSDDAAPGTTPQRTSTSTGSGGSAGATGKGTGGGSGGSTTSTGSTMGTGGSGGSATGGTGGSATGGTGGSGGATGGAGGATGGNGGTGAAGGGGSVDAGAIDAGGSPTYDVAVGPITLAPGEERTVCVDKKIAANHSVDVVKIASEMTKGGHHLVFYKSAATVESTTPFACQTFRDVLGGTVPLYIAQKPSTELNFPAGVAYTMPASQMLRVELHFVNTTPQPLAVTGTVHLGEAKEGTITEHANLMFYGNVGIFLPPQSMATVGPSFHAIAPGRKIFGLTGHQHRLGTSVTIELAPDALTSGTELYKNTNWDEPPLTIFNPPLTPTGTQGLRYTCTYNNTTNGIVTFGENADQEMCFLWAYYYPDQGFDISF